MFGGKGGNGTYQSIINKIPPHERYIELFLGSGAILNNKKPAQENIGVEIHSGTIARYTYPAEARIFQDDVFGWCEAYWNLFTEDTFVFLDPPYPLGSRKNKTEVYANELSDQQHEDLLQLIKTMPAMVGITTYENPIYQHHLKDWNLYTFYSMTRRGLAKEFYYFNYPEPTALHDYQYLGKDFTDRQRIKRKIQREIAKLKHLPPLERAAIIQAVTSL
jgi:DNA adenine methylase